ncbi:MAG: IS200/IS605 family transposase [Bacteroidetes bacterium]|nr:IS200/IS605 family transposase [Bacteroidota bacterium]
MKKKVTWNFHLAWSDASICEKETTMGSFTQITYQLVFATKDRTKNFVESEQERLFRYIQGILKKKNCHMHGINGYQNHLHVVFELHPSVALADLVKDVKVSTSLWIKQNKVFPYFTGWGEKYGAFTYGSSERTRLTEYVKNQKPHHQKVDFEEEFKQLLKEHGVDYDDRFLL